MTSLLLYLLLLPAVIASGVAGKRVPCDDKTPQLVRVPQGRITTLNFPLPPKEAIPGDSGFDIKRMDSDLVIKAVRATAKTNLVVYLENRRCFFHLEVHAAGDESVFVRDPKEKMVEVKYVDK